MNRKVYSTQNQNTDHDACRDYIFRSFKKYLGDENVYLHYFKVDDYEGLANVIALKQGKSCSNEIIVLSAHYDSNNAREELVSEPGCSPGANDNGTGVAAILEIARVLAQVETEKSILFAAWDFEEKFTDGFPGGSNSWFSEHVIKKKNVDWNEIKNGGKIKINQLIANINFDMFGHPNDTVNGKLVLWACSGNVVHSDFINDYVSIFKNYLPEIEVVNYGKLIYSDHYTFAARKIPSVENLESDYSIDPFYHTCSDNLENTDNINFDFAANVTRGGLAFTLEKVGISIPRDPKNITTFQSEFFYEAPGAYYLKLPDNDFSVKVIDCFGNNVVTFKQCDISVFYPQICGMHEIIIYNGASLMSKRVFLQKKEGPAESFF